MVAEELPKSHYGYCLGYDGIWRFKIPNYDKLDKPEIETELKIECVFNWDPHLLSINNGFFSSGHNVYILSGKDDHPLLHVLDSTPFEKKEFPVKNPNFLNQPTISPSTKFDTLMSPIVIQANSQIYFLTQYTSPWFGKYVENICLQSFDPTEMIFRNLPSPIKATDFLVAAHFAALDYIYFFIQENLGDIVEIDQYNFTRALSFNTKTSEWKEEPKSMLTEFRVNAIPIPYLHRGDTGVSEEFDQNTRILVALSDSTLTAYCVTLGSDGSLTPNSYRHLTEIESRSPTGVVQLHNIGSGRFCTIHESFQIPLIVTVFDIDFKAEYVIQSTKKVSTSSASSAILSSRIFLDDSPSFYAYCLASAPAPGSEIDTATASTPAPGSEIDTATEQDRDVEMNEITH